jgi:hypothetical protein
MKMATPRTPFWIAKRLMTLSTTGSRRAGIRAARWYAVVPARSAMRSAIFSTGGGAP